MTIDFKALAKQVKDTGPDLTKASAGGGDYVPPKPGPTRLRFVGYIEQGTHTTQWKGTPKTKPRAEFIFELSGPNHPPREFEGKKIPVLVSFKEVVGRHIKNGYMKLFKIMAQDTPEATNFVELLGNAYRGEIVHGENKNNPDRPYINLKKEGSYTLQSVNYIDPEDGVTVKTVKVDEPLSQMRVFLWDYADLAQWDSIHIEGTYDNGDSKNKYQEKIKIAENLTGSAIYEALVAAGREAELVPAPKVAKEDDQEGDDDEPEKAAGGAKKADKKPSAAQPTKTALGAADDGADPLAGV